MGVWGVSLLRQLRIMPYLLLLNATWLTKTHQSRFSPWRAVITPLSFQSHNPCIKFSLKLLNLMQKSKSLFLLLILGYGGLLFLFSLDSANPWSLWHPIALSAVVGASLKFYYLCWPVKCRLRFMAERFWRGISFLPLNCIEELGDLSAPNS